MREARASAQGIGARLGRKEDDRLLRGRGQFVADIRLPGMKDVAFLRSPVAHARIRGISIPSAQRSSTFTAADLIGVRPVVPDRGSADEHRETAEADADAGRPDQYRSRDAVRT